MAPKRTMRATALALVVLATASACASVPEGSLPTPSGTETPLPVVEQADAADVEAERRAVDESPESRRRNPTGLAPTPPPIDTSSIRVESASFEDFDPPTSPVSISVEALDLDAPIIPVGIVEETGEMELPGAVEVAWYRFAGRPGDDVGSSVIAAHVDWNGIPGPFFQLREVVEGDYIDVGLDDGSTATYIVEQVVSFPKNDLPDEYFRTDGPHQIVLITCGGDFDDAARSYVDNVAVVAVPANRPPPAELSDNAA